MNNNKLIAEFMGVDTQITSIGDIHSWSDSPFYYTTEDSKEKVMENIAEYSKYHTSWDWLMPVVHKIDEACGQRNALGLYIGEDIDVVYDAVVEFIKDESYFLCGSCSEECSEYTYSEDRDVDECNDCKTSNDEQQ
jgi:hypothetical protein